MDGGTTLARLIENGAPLSTLLVAAFVAWQLAKRSGSVKAMIAQRPWFGAIADMSLFLAAAHGAGGLAVALVAAFGWERWQSGAQLAVALLIYLGVAFVAGRFVEAWLGSSRRGRDEAVLSQLGRTVLYVLCMVIGLLVFVATYHLAPTKVFLSAGFFTAFLALATRQILSDLVSGLAMGFERSFRIGDWIRLSDGVEGEVIDVSWRTTRLRGWDNATCAIPNGVLAGETLTNLHRRGHPHARSFDVRVSADADPALVKQILKAAAMNCPGILSNPAPSARLKDGGTIPYTYYLWVYFPD
ncbi:mechanosensitive ion channel family protein [Albimonas sp. CAU 1670]|uniref:mechanosensitive ion channel family protein n=1 Tax=Albimonas sp. CAU 1670 TaxID=3032599 RepID=UPI0023DC32B9|nr:mechanosensitive ion channel family protein [Albimonas sp. CAU 1670]MDF2233155.1 mechanosensitive ion channel family protein [Albimonas sp. CAU 1670]